ncbi:glycosyltransferase family 2 protein [Pontibacter qinzhouensis]|uniref:Glycosyltransferase family 2 protein n=1 Tax=Pontibacter qinzhouensis TaxID=2603253 RepID=A0A5C8K6L6_9BACT|nr:glycosyltransferase family 2 protein [Pontibacter qinzhouensis]TXK44899.1 glycosyltransferase family 2 protein [Pontibacter qinzhouensis]
MIVASIVAYKTKAWVINQTILSLLSSEHINQIFVYDNSPTDCLRTEIIVDDCISYHFNNNNIGFGKAHNFCINKSLKASKYHIILNPDVYFEGNIINNMLALFQSDPNIGLVAPKILYPNGQLQLSCRSLPTPFDIIIRRIPFIKNLFSKRCRFHQFLHTSYNKTMNVPFLLGCFLMIRKDVLEEVGGFDEQFFLYMEDLDLCRRINQKYQTLYYPQTTIYHLYERASAKQFYLFIIHISSMIKYFNKWSWFDDSERENINNNLKKLS